MRTPIRTCAAVLPAAALVAVAAAGARAQTTADSGRQAPASGHVSREGLTIDFAVGPADAPAVAPQVLRAGDNVAVRFTIRDGGSGTPVSSLNPAAWVALARSAPDGPRATCGDQARQAISPSFNGRPELDLNTYYVLALNADATISVVDPLFGFGGSKLPGARPAAESRRGLGAHVRPEPAVRLDARRPRRGGHRHEIVDRRHQHRSRARAVASRPAARRGLPVGRRCRRRRVGRPARHAADRDAPRHRPRPAPDRVQRRQPVRLRRQRVRRHGVGRRHQAAADARRRRAGRANRLDGVFAARPGGLRHAPGRGSRRRDRRRHPSRDRAHPDRAWRRHAGLRSRRTPRLRAQPADQHGVGRRRGAEPGRAHAPRSRRGPTRSRSPAGSPTFAIATARSLS